MKFTKEQVDAFAQTYTCDKAESGTDLHQEFADKLGIKRQEAKVLCHKIYWHLHGTYYNYHDLVGNQPTA